MRDRRAAERRGRLGEALALIWLRLTGWRVLATRLRTPAGEIDILARRGRTLLAVEVKTRATGAELDLAIDRPRLARVARAAELVAPRYRRPGDDLRIDVILLAPGTRPRRIANAWTG
jgi:putative endonuclease